MPDRTKQIRHEMNNLNSATRARMITRAEMNTLNSTMLQKIRDVDTNRPETTFTFAIPDAKSFLDSKKRRGSEFFYCRSMKFYLGMKHAYWQDGYYLEVFLFRFNPSDVYDYSITTEFELRLINFGGKPDKVLKVKHTFEKSNTYDGRGERQFIAISDLTNLSNGWIKDDTIKLQLHLKCNEFRRIN